MRPLAEAVRSIESWIGKEAMPEARRARFLANDRAALLAAARVPCLLLYGERDGIKPEMLRTTRLSPLIAAREIPGADHEGRWRVANRSSQSSGASCRGYRNFDGLRQGANL